MDPNVIIGAVVVVVIIIAIWYFCKITEGARGSRRGVSYDKFDDFDINGFLTKKAIDELRHANKLCEEVNYNSTIKKNNKMAIRCMRHQFIAHNCAAYSLEDARKDLQKGEEYFRKKYKLWFGIVKVIHGPYGSTKGLRRGQHSISARGIIAIYDPKKALAHKDFEGGWYKGKKLIRFLKDVTKFVQRDRYGCTGPMKFYGRGKKFYSNGRPHPDYVRWLRKYKTEAICGKGYAEKTDIGYQDVEPWRDGEKALNCLRKLYIENDCKLDSPYWWDPDGKVFDKPEYALGHKDYQGPFKGQQLRIAAKYFLEDDNNCKLK